MPAETRTPPVWLSLLGMAALVVLAVFGALAAIAGEWNVAMLDLGIVALAVWFKAQS